MLLVVKYLENFLKQNGYGFNSEFLTLNWYIFVALANKKLCLNYNEVLSKILSVMLKNL